MLAASSKDSYHDTYELLGLGDQSKESLSPFWHTIYSCAAFCTTSTWDPRRMLLMENRVWGFESSDWFQTLWR
jgi:hypothetical protein